MKNQKLWITSIIILIVVLVWLAFFWQPATPAISTHSQSQISATAAGGDFTLSSPTGRISLADYRGKVVAVYFGYTFCPDVCPTALANLAQALATLTPSELEKVQGLFISVDPERDTMDVLKVYAPYFHPNLLGLSGSPAQVAEVAGQYGARYMKQKPNADGLYSVDHSSFTYIIGPDGKLITSLPHGSPPQQIVDMIRKLINK
jgi:protein SCO1/2